MGGSAYLINEWTDVADAILFSFYSGLEGGNALADILSGDVNPGGKLPFTIAKREEDYPSFLHIGSDSKEIDYGYYHGYTLLDKNNIEPEFPFGFGLSYTDFDITDCAVSQNNNTATVTCEIKNIGTVDGDEVLQVYIASDDTAKERPVKLLKGFRRVSVKANSSTKAEVTVDIDDIRFYNPEISDWELDGSYSVYVGNSSRNIKLIGKLSFNK